MRRGNAERTAVEVPRPPSAERYRDDEAIRGFLKERIEQLLECRHKGIDKTVFQGRDDHPSRENGQPIGTALLLAADDHPTGLFQPQKHRGSAVNLPQSA